MGSVHFRRKLIMIREAEWPKEGRKVQPEVSAWGAGMKGRRRKGRRGRRRGGRREKVARTSAWNINLHSSYVLSQVLSSPHFSPCPACLSLSLSVSPFLSWLPVFASL